MNPALRHTIQRTLIFGLLGLGFTSTAWSHQPSDSYLSLSRSSGTLEGRWDIPLVDLELALALDSNADGILTWGEVRRRHNDIASFAFDHLRLTRGGEPCDSAPTGQAIEQHGETPYNVLYFTIDCSQRGVLEGHYSLFFDVDPSHRGLLRLQSEDNVTSAVLAPTERRFLLADEATGHSHTVRTFLKEGIVHIWIGYDHILFLLTLLLPAVLWRPPNIPSEEVWHGVPSFRPAATEVVKVVTAFTVAHSLTLTIAVLGWLTLPSRWVEVSIAATIILAALHNLRPIVHGKVWALAFVLGLIHGFGFAGVLAELELPRSSLAIALASFNIGVEAGQLAIVAMFLPIAYALRRTWVYQRLVMVGGSLAVAVVAAYWLWERIGSMPGI